ncbi:MAG TPA: MaoC/PaaZ C-terminal domain-containing protein [Acidimicrobiia bacterium]|nr:MaoC/PaaZ C-terminal domain-containing protein [Acidimicrobiia bacterium]
MTQVIHLGHTVGPFEGRIDDDAALAYALATDDPNPVYVDGDAVPPLYTVSLALPALLRGNHEGVDIGAMPGVRAGVHGEHDVFFHQPVSRGMRLRWSSVTHAAANTPAGVLVTQRIVLTDAADAPVVEHLWSTLYVGGTIDEPLGPAIPEHTFPEPAREHPLGSHTFAVTRDQSFRYAGASTDHAPIHIDDEAARRAGFPSKFLQGLCTFAMCSGAVVKVAAGGDPLILRRIAGRFASPVFPRHELVVEVFDAGSMPDGGRCAAFEATSAGRVVVKHGRAELAA